jgi:hypothetical protein
LKILCKCLQESSTIRFFRAESEIASAIASAQNSSRPRRNERAEKRIKHSCGPLGVHASAKLHVSPDSTTLAATAVESEVVLSLYLDQTELAEVVSVVRGVDYVGVVQFAEGFQFFDDQLDGGVHRLEGLEAFGHQEVGELLVDRLHLLRHLENPLFVRVGGVVVGRGVVRGDVEEEVGILGSRVFRPVGRRERHRQHDRFVGAVLLRLPQKGDGVVGDQVGVVVLVIIEAVLDLLPVHVYGVVVVLGVHYEPTPFAPPWRDVRPVVFVQVLPEISCPVSGVGQVGGEGPRLVGGLPLRAGAIVVVGVDVVVVDVHPGQERGPRGTAHGRRDVGVPELGALVPDGAQRLRHKVQRAELDVLVVGQDQHDVRLALSGRRRGEDGALALAPLGEHVAGGEGGRRQNQEERRGWADHGAGGGIVPRKEGDHMVGAELKPSENKPLLI